MRLATVQATSGDAVLRSLSLGGTELLPLIRPKASCTTEANNCFVLGMRLSVPAGARKALTAATREPRRSPWRRRRKDRASYRRAFSLLTRRRYVGTSGST